MTVTRTHLAISMFAAGITSLLASTSAQAQFVARGEWSPSEIYQINDLVTHRGSTWRGLTTSRYKPPGRTQPSTSGFWQVFSAGYNNLGDWSSKTKYHPNDVVTFAGSAWRAKLTSVNRKPDYIQNGVFWEQMVAGLNHRGSWSSASAYNVGDVVVYNGSSFRSLRSNGNQNRPPVGNTLGAFWELVVERGATGPAGADGADGATGATGPQGPTGPTGLTGATGPMGPVGATGPQGATGPMGPTGPQGATGPIGPAGITALDTPWGIATAYNVNDVVVHQGSAWRAKLANTGIEPGTNPTNWQQFAAKGDTGAVGPAGADGADGATGPVGPAGPVGPTGADGAVGAVGPQGPIGPVGAVGPQGPVGPTGADGAIGPQGAVGPIGPVGAVGPQGPVGPTGADGAVGPQGAVGPIGPVGAVGPQGPVGPTGADGAIGPQGAVGPMGPVGAVGPQGPIGPVGPIGATGAQGPVGPVGATGANGAQGPAGFTNVVIASRILPSIVAAGQTPFSTPFIYPHCVLQITTNGNSKVLLQANITMGMSGSSFIGGVFRRNTTELTTNVVASDFSASTQTQLLSMSWVDTPAAGTHTYDVLLRSPVNPTTAQAGYIHSTHPCTFTALEVGQ
jgi:chitodextrinase